MSEGDREFPPCAPDIAADVRSPRDSLSYLARKIELYLSHGALVVLDVDPLTRTIVVNDADGTRTLAEDERFSQAAVDWLSFGFAMCSLIWTFRSTLRQAQGDKG